MLPQCSSAWTRWVHDECYCPLGLFYPNDASAGGTAFSVISPFHDGQSHAFAPVDVGAPGVAPNVSAKALDELSGFGQDPSKLCSVRGLDVWHGRYIVYIGVTYVYFVVLAGWCVVQLFRLRRTVLKILHRAIYAFAFGATAVRLCYLSAEGALVFATGPHLMGALQDVAGVTYSVFFPLSASTFLCICQHWLRLIYVLEDEVENAWHRNPLYIVCLVLLSLEALYDVCYLIGTPPAIDAVYFVWLALISLTLALVGLYIARRLYGLLRMWFNERSQLFRKVMISSLSVSVLSMCFLLLSIVQALYGRFYAWPNLSCWIVGRCLEAIYLTMLFSAIGPVDNRHRAVPSGSRGSWISHISSSSSPNMMATEKFWIASSSTSVLSMQPCVSSPNGRQNQWNDAPGFSSQFSESHAGQDDGRHLIR